MDGIFAEGPMETLVPAQVPLTPMERKVVDLVAVGYSAKEVALELGNISESTVKVHTKGAMIKYNVRNRTELALKVHGIEFKPYSSRGRREFHNTSASR